MRLIMWIITIALALTGLALRADHGAWLGGAAYLGEWLSRGCFILAVLACPFLWTRSYGLVPRPLQVPGRHRMMLALALIVAAPLILPFAH
jgi:hypothetical protein